MDAVRRNAVLMLISLAFVSCRKVDAVPEEGTDSLSVDSETPTDSGSSVAKEDETAFETGYPSTDRTEERRVGKEWRRLCKFRVEPLSTTKNKNVATRRQL